MEIIFSGLFILILLAFSAASLFLTQKAIDLFNVTTTLFRYVVAALSSGIIVFGAKFAGSTAIGSILAMFGYADTLPPDVGTDSWFVYLLIWVGSFAISGGWFDWRKYIQQ